MNSNLPKADFARHFINITKFTKAAFKVVQRILNPNIENILLRFS